MSINELLKHAFAFAERHVSIEDAARYAEHYVQNCCDLENEHYPSHAETFLPWCRQHEIARD